MNIKDDISAIFSDHHFEALSPIDDVRATQGYRMSVSKALVARAISSLAGGN